MSSESDRAIDLALEVAEGRSGIGRGAGAPGWVRDRVRSVLEGQAARQGLDALAAARRMATDRGAVEELVSALRVGETRFYRDRAQWEACQKAVLPTFPESVEIFALSAGCSTGEEAYTLAMMLTTARRRFRVLGVDRSAEALAAARSAVYAVDSARDLPATWLRRFFDREGEEIRLRAEIRDQVTFEECDLVQRIPRGPFHVVFFKNVLLYLAAPAGEAVAARLAAELAAGGVLFGATSEIPRLRRAGLTSVRLAGAVTAFQGPAARAAPR